MEVTIGHVFDMWHIFKQRNIQTMETKKRRIYAEHYQQQRLAKLNWLLLQWLQIRWANVVMTVYNSYGF